MSSVRGAGEPERLEGASGNRKGVNPMEAGAMLDWALDAQGRLPDYGLMGEIPTRFTQPTILVFQRAALGMAVPKEDIDAARASIIESIPWVTKEVGSYEAFQPLFDQTMDFLDALDPDLGEPEKASSGKGESAEDLKLKVLDASLKAARDLVEDLDPDCPVRLKVLSHVNSALALMGLSVSVVLILLYLTGFAATGDLGSPLSS